MRHPDTKYSSGMKRSVAVLLLAGLTGCAVGPDYQRPDSGLPEQFNPNATRGGEAAQANDAVALQDKAWWERFGDPVLNDLVTRALAHNYDIRVAVATVEQAEGLAREARAAFFPEIDLNAGSTRNRVSTVTQPPLQAGLPALRDDRKAALGTSFELDVWGRLRRASEAARADLLSSRYARDTVELSVAGLVTSSYLTLRAADASSAATTNTLDTRRNALEIAKARLEAGKASPIDVYQAEGSVASAEAQAADLRRQRGLAENQLALLTGQPGLTIPAGDLRQLPIPPVPPVGLPSALLAARPDVRQAEETLISQNARIGVAKAAIFPTISLTGSYGSESGALTDLFSSAAGTWGLGVGLAMPIFDAGRNFARIDQASARQRQALATYQKTVQTAFKEVNDALIGLRENRQGDEAQARQVQATQKTLELAQVRYEAGYSAFLEVLDAQRSANDALIAFIGVRQARLNSAVDLFKALGGGWKDDYRDVSLANSGASESGR